MFLHDGKYLYLCILALTMLDKDEIYFIISIELFGILEFSQETVRFFFGRIREDQKSFRNHLTFNYLLI